MEQYAFLIPALVIIWVFIIAIQVGSYLDRHAKPESEIMEVPEKACPPHRWKWLDQPGMENTQYMICLWCNKTPRQISEEP